MTDNFQYPDNTKYSSCCGEEDRCIRGGDASYQDYGICPACRDHCDWITLEELEKQDNG